MHKQIHEVCGSYSIQTMEHCHRMIRKDTSAGEYWGTTKREVFWNDLPELMERTGRVFTEPAEVMRKQLLWRVSAKHELLPKKKEMRKERITSSVPPEINLYTIAVVGDHHDRLYQNWNKLPIRVGVSKFMGEYYSLFAAHSRFKKHRVYDVAALESSFRKVQHEIIAACEGKLASNVAHGRHVENLGRYHQEWLAALPTGEVIQVEAIQPSGSGKTISDNSKLVASCFIGALEREGLVKGIDYGLSVVGDDDLLSFNCEEEIIDRAEHFLLGYFGLKREAEGDTIWGLPFLGATCYAGRGPRSVRPEKILQGVIRKSTSPELAAIFLAGAMNELYNQDEKHELLRMAQFVEQKHGVKVQFTDPFTLEALYSRNITEVSF